MSLGEKIVHASPNTKIMRLSDHPLAFMHVLSAQTLLVMLLLLREQRDTVSSHTHKEV